MIHGGEFEDNRIKTDFSVNINPVKTPESITAAMKHAVDYADRYPQLHSEKLTEALADRFKIGKNQILTGNGSSELFTAVANAFSPCTVMIPVPSFYGYEYAVSANNTDLRFTELNPDEDFAVTEGFFERLKNEWENDGKEGLLFLANPNNPTGKRIEIELLTKIISYCGERNIFVVLDECFYEFTGGTDSMFERVEEFSNLIVIGSFTKTFSIPSVRIGYLACGNEEVIGKIGRQLPEWNVSGIAQAAGMECLKHPEHMKKSAEYIKKERDYLAENLRVSGIKVFDSGANFLLLYSELPLYEECLKCGIGIRDASNFRGLKKGYYRIAVRTHEENRMLTDTIRKIAGL